MNRWLKWGLGTLALTILAWGGIYFYGSQSEPYRVSERWLRDSAEVRNEVGLVKRTRLSMWGVFSDKLRGTVREARVSTFVEGENGSLIADLWLEKHGDQDWLVVRCTLERP